MPSEHYFSPRPSASDKQQAFSATLRGHEVTLTTEAGVFSRQRVDRGTRLMIKHIEIDPSDTVLDLGCGYGVVGVVAGLLAPRGRVTLVDINQRAVALARANLRANGIENADVHQGDGFAPILGQTFDVIAINPPIRAGISVTHRLIAEAVEHLVPGGRFYLVGRTKQGVVRIAEKMHAVFGGVQEIGKGGGFRVYLSRRANTESQQKGSTCESSP
jgi:16S rRNA (guanine1207-N2)-methyltransferase